MCGLAGVVSWDARYPVTPEILARVSEAIAHRGPDGEGVYLNHAPPGSPDRPQCGLVHRRLAILDIDDRSLQPFDDGLHKHLLVYNGEIYNFRPLRDELARLHPQYTWRTTGDTEVLLVALQTWGVRACEKLNGMYAFAYWDQQDGALVLARDRMGQKPLFYASPPGGGAIAFASELHALRQLPWFDTSVDPHAMGDYLRWGYVPAPATIYTHARKLPPAHVARTTGKGLSLFRYYDPNVNVPREQSPAHAVEQTRQLLTQAVRRQLVSDVPVGCFLSGGVDSSILALAMQRSMSAGQKVLTFSIGFDDARYDESGYAEAVAKQIGTEHRTFRVAPDASADLPKLARAFGEPFADSSALPTHYLARATREHVKVALSGDGGDELFGGYDRYRAILLAERVDRLPRVLGWMMRRSAWQALPGTHPKSRLLQIKRFLASLSLAPAVRYASYMRLFDDNQLSGLLNLEHQAWIKPTDDWLAGAFDRLAASRDAASTAAAVDRVTYLPEDLLAKVDRASMLHALEVRSPFMDHDVVNFAAALDAPLLLKGGGKRLLREAFAGDLPREVFARRKMGFAVPIGDWFKTHLRDMLEDALFARDSFASSHFVTSALRSIVDDHLSGRQDHSQRLYALLMLELWWKGS